MNLLTIFGLFSVTAMLIFYALERRSQRFVLAFAFACVMGSGYGFLQGAWPFGLVELVWAFIAFRRWRSEWRRRESTHYVVGARWISAAHRT